MVFIDACVILDLNIMFKQNVYRNIFTTVVITDVITTVLPYIYDSSQQSSLLPRGVDLRPFASVSPMNGNIDDRSPRTECRV